MMTFLLMVHGIVAVALLGGFTHQAFAACWPSRRKHSMATAFRAVDGATYTNTMIALFLVQTLVGGIVYTAYRITVRTYLENARLWAANGSFEMKEQFVAVGLGLLPLYWSLWRRPLDPDRSLARAIVTATLCFVVWYGFLAGHYVNNIRGLFGQ